jgi:hypothetical protein
MTQVITRFFDDPAQADSVKFEMLQRRRFPPGIVRLYGNADGLADALIAADVDAATAREYQDRVARGGAVLMVRAGAKPLGVARMTRELMADMGAADLGDLTEEVFVAEPPPSTLSVLPGAPYMLFRPRDPDSTDFYMANWPIGLISRRKPYTGAVFPPGAHMANWPIPLISRRKPFTGSIFPPHKRMANFPIPLISHRKPFTGSIFPPHRRMADFPIPLISRRRPFTGKTVLRNAFMANWPFPHLINGKTHTNSLMPGEPHMAAFPIPLLSDRKPFTGSIFPPHKRMANFPIPLISHRKPFAKSIFPPHKRMADAILPLIIPRGETDTEYGDSGFSFSRLLGIPTILRR